MTEHLEESEERDDTVVATALKWSLTIFGVVAVLAIGVAYLLNRGEPPALPIESELAEVDLRDVSVAEIPTISFTDITIPAGIDFVHENGARGAKLLPETMGSGCVFFDFDRDGDQDLLLVNSQTWDEFNGKVSTPTSFPGLYENDGTGQFKNVTAESGLNVSLYGTGVACGDFDNDGLVDVYLAALGTNRLFRNLGQGKFEDVTVASGTGGGGSEWSTSCGWFDYDRDGDLDLFVCNYVKWSQAFDEAQNFQLTGGDRAYGRPQNFEGTFPYLFRNEGNLKFSEVSEAAGLQLRNPATNVPMAKSLGVTFDDFNNDGWLDIIVANDTVQNFLFVNQQDGSFKEIGTIAGIAFDMNGEARGAMGIDSAYFRNNESIGVAIGNFSNEMTALYVADRTSLQFVDEAIPSGLGPTTRLSLTFGLFFFDYDLDGRLDLFSANGHLEQDINRVQPSQFYEQPPQLFWNCGSQYDTEFLQVPETIVGSDFSRPIVGRGASYADIDGDGDLDIVIVTTGQKPRLLRNEQRQQHHWLRVLLAGNEGLSIGALIEVETADATYRHRVSPTRSYQSQVEAPATFGLGSENSVKRVVVHWNNGEQTEITSPAVDAELVIEAP